MVNASCCKPLIYKVMQSALGCRLVSLQCQCRFLSSTSPVTMPRAEWDCSSARRTCLLLTAVSAVDVCWTTYPLTRMGSLAALTSALPCVGCNCRLSLNSSLRHSSLQCELSYTQLILIRHSTQLLYRWITVKGSQENLEWLKLGVFNHPLSYIGLYRLLFMNRINITTKIKCM